MGNSNFEIRITNEEKKKEGLTPILLFNRTQKPPQGRTTDYTDEHGLKSGQLWLARDRAAGQIRGMRPYFGIFGLVLLVYGGGGLIGAAHRASTTHGFDEGLFVKSGAVFGVIACVGLGMMAKAAINFRSDRAAKK